MSERSPKPDRKVRGKGLRNAAMAGALLLTGAVGGQAVEKVVETPGVEYFASSGEIAESSATKAAEMEIAEELALEHYLPVAHDITAAVLLKDGSQINIENPIVISVPTELDVNGRSEDPTNDIVTVAERTRGSDAGEGSPVTAYAVGENNVESITYFGQNLSSDGESIIANVNINPTPLVRAYGLSEEGSGNFFQVRPVGEIESDPAYSATHVAQGAEYLKNN
ncbi:MAG: hypothetical protein AAB459_00945 [Patescibacteria group bacterium]|jgi:hypothetical protein